MAYLKKNPEALRVLQIEVKTQSQWDNLISSDGLIVVDAYAGWCGPCTAIISTFRKLKNEIGDQMLKFATAVTENIDSLAAYNGYSKPTFLFYGGGELLNVIRGCKAPQLIKDITRLLQLEHQILDGKADRKVYIDPEVSHASERQTENRSTTPAQDDDDAINEDEEEIADAMTVRMSRSKISQSSVEVKKETSMVIVKPDAVKEGLTEEIIEKITRAGIQVMEKVERTLSRDEVENLYLQHKDMDYFNELVNFMTSDKSIVLLVCKEGNNSGQGFIEELRELLGPRDVSLAKQEAPDSLRAKYGTDTIRNALHACDSGESAARELAFFFPDFNAPTVQERRKKVQLQRTLALIRPGALHRKDSILERVKEAGFVIAMSKELQLSRQQAEGFYNEHRGSEHFESLVDHMTSGPCMALCLAREEAVSAWRDLIGPKDVKVAKEDEPESLRAVFAEDEIPINPLHGADCEQAAQKEIEQIFPMQSTVAVIKPDAYNEPQQREAIINKIKDAGFTISAQKEINLTKDLASQFYREHEGKEFYNDLTSYMSSGPTLFMVLSREDAVEGFRAVLGPTDPEMARSMAPMSLRAIHAKDSLHNAIHGSSNPEKAQQTIANFFTTEELMARSNNLDKKTSNISANNQDTFVDENSHGISKDQEVSADDAPIETTEENVTSGSEDQSTTATDTDKVEQPENEGSSELAENHNEEINEVANDEIRSEADNAEAASDIDTGLDDEQAFKKAQMAESTSDKVNAVDDEDSSNNKGDVDTEVDKDSHKDDQSATENQNTTGTTNEKIESETMSDGKEEDATGQVTQVDMVSEDKSEANTEETIVVNNTGEEHANAKNDIQASPDNNINTSDTNLKTEENSNGPEEIKTETATTDAEEIDKADNVEGSKNETGTDATEQEISQVNDEQCNSVNNETEPVENQGNDPIGEKDKQQGCDESDTQTAIDNEVEHEVNQVSNETEAVNEADTATVKKSPSESNVEKPSNPSDEGLQNNDVRNEATQQEQTIEAQQNENEQSTGSSKSPEKIESEPMEADQESPVQEESNNDTPVDLQSTEDSKADESDKLPETSNNQEINPEQGVDPKRDESNQDQETNNDGPTEAETESLEKDESNKESSQIQDERANEEEISKDSDAPVQVATDNKETENVKTSASSSSVKQDKDEENKQNLETADDKNQ